MRIGKNIRAIRVSQKMEQKELADRLHISNKTISSWECDRTEPNIGMFEKIADALNVTKAELLEGRCSPETIFDKDFGVVAKKRSSYEKFRKICLEREVKPSDVSKATGISSATLSSWKKGVYSPKIDKISKIANFFHVDASYFDDDALNVPVTSARIVSEDEQRLTNIFNRLSSDGKKRLLERAMELEQLGFTEKNTKKEA